MEMIRRVTVLGATGSVGASTLDLVGRDPERFPVEALTAGSNVERLIELARLHRPRFVAIADESRYGALKDGLAGTGIAVGAGDAAGADLPLSASSSAISDNQRAGPLPRMSVAAAMVCTWAWSCRKV